MTKPNFTWFENRNSSPIDFLLPGTKYVPDEVYNERLATCETCVFYTKMSPRRCKQCNCWMKAKALFAHSYCPLHKWEQWEGKVLEVEGEIDQERKEKAQQLNEAIDAAIHAPMEEETSHSAQFQMYLRRS